MSAPVDQATPPHVPGLQDRVGGAAAPLALAVVLLLFLQWPLRDAIGAWATHANDLAQWLFALYVAVAIGHAGHRGTHLVARPDLAATGPRRGLNWRDIGHAMCLLPWAVFLLVSAWPAVQRSVLSLERFPETFNAGYFMIKVALLVLGVTLLIQSAAALLGALRRQPR